MKPQDFTTFANAILSAPIMRHNSSGDVTQPPAVTAAAAIAAKVDDLGLIRAAIADLEKQASDIRAELERAGLDRIEGQFFTATLSTHKGASRTDWKTIAARFKPSAQLIRAYTTTGKASTHLNVTARQVTH